MKQSRGKVAKTVADRTLKSGSSKKFSQEIAAYLLHEHRVNDLNSLLRDVQAAWAERGYVEVIATTAHPLTQQNRATIIKQIKQLYPKAEKVIVTEVHDPSVKGGVQVNLAHDQLDLSIEAKLNKFKQLTTAGKD